MNYSKTTLNRRAFLYAAGTAGVALPFLEGMPGRSAFAQTPTKKGYALFICTANGVVQNWKNQDPEKFWPTEVGALTTESMNAFADDRCTGMLADYADRLLIVSGVNYPAGLSGCGHAQGLVQCLTARPSSGGGNGATSTGVSVDSVMSDALNPEGVGPLTLYSGIKEGFINEKLSFSAAGQVRSAESNPYNTYQRLAGLLDEGTGQPTGMADQLAARKKSVNDLVRDQINDLKAKPQLSQADRDRLDLHFTTIRDLENNMQQMGLSCTDDGIDLAAIEAMSNGNAFRQNGVIEEVAKMQMDLVALTFACGANRVATLQVGDGTDATRYTINGEVVERFHYISHRVESNGPSGTAIPKAVEWHTAIDRIRMETFKYLLDRWSTYDTPDGPLLDNGFAMWTSHISVGPSHSQENLPIIIAGSPSGFLKQGAYIDAGGVSNAMVMNTLLTAVGVPTEDFGDGGTGLIDGMVA
jgi:hypothetical protein